VVGSVKIGVLALQGNHNMHSNILDSLGVEPINIRYPSELDIIEGLVIPGGESTTMSKLMKRIGFCEPLKSFAKYYPVLGTCAGLILMSKQVVNAEINSLDLLDVKTERNGYGRQICSNTVKVEFNLENTDYSIPASFIRAPKIISYGKSINVIAKYENDPIIIENDKHIGISFHPELDNITFLHEYTFLRKKMNKN